VIRAKNDMKKVTESKLLGYNNTTMNSKTPKSNSNETTSKLQQHKPSKDHRPKKKRQHKAQIKITK